MLQCVPMGESMYVCGCARVCNRLYKCPCTCSLATTDCIFFKLELL